MILSALDPSVPFSLALMMASQRLHHDSLLPAPFAAWFAQRGVTRFKTPEFVTTLDALPVLAAGKPDRAALRALASKFSS